MVVDWVLEIWQNRAQFFLNRRKPEVDPTTRVVVTLAGAGLARDGVRQRGPANSCVLDRLLLAATRFLV